jgi:hypothetical protein
VNGINVFYFQTQVHEIIYFEFVLVFRQKFQADYIRDLFVVCSINIFEARNPILGLINFNAFFNGFYLRET